MNVTVKIPATSANLGPGFDTLGVALKLYNTVRLEPATTPQLNPMIAEAVELFYRTIKRKPQKLQPIITGDVPISRGLGSSVTVRLGVLTALNAWENYPLAKEKILELIIELEGHPDNAVPAFYGGFSASNGHTHFRVSIASKLSFIALIPSYELETKKARAVLPKKISREDAVINLQTLSVITAAFATRRYELLPSVFEDRLHQPYRAKLIPGFNAVLKVAQQQGALGAYLSGAGSTIMALTLSNPQAIAKAMLKEFHKHGDLKAKTLILKPDNTGVKIIPN